MFDIVMDLILQFIGVMPLFLGVFIFVGMISSLINRGSR